jgi:hypothetical protein
MLGSHWVAYFIAAPDPHDRAHLLRSTGHAYLPIVISVAIAAAVFGLGKFIAGRFSPALRRSRSQIFSTAVPRFLGLQLGGFAALEIIERMVAGHGFGLDSLGEKTFLVGLAVQALTAVLAAILLVLVAFVIDHLVRPAATPTHNTAAPTFTSLISAPRLLPATGAHTLRGPPTIF